MNEKLELKLYNKFPWLEPTDGYGLGVGDGWYDLLYVIGEYITNAVNFENECIKRYKKHPEGFTWKPRDKKFEFPIVHQVKEKFGGLRFYFSMDTKQLRYEVRGFVDAIESISFRICEECGNKGKPRNEAWVRTLCNDCYIQWQKNSNKRFSKLKEMELQHKLARSKEIENELENS